MPNLYQPYLDFALDTARRAGALIREKTHTAHKIDKKGRINLVTEVDRASEELIFSAIRKAYPEHSILGEEQGKVSGQESNCRWIVDPLDGTTNFASAYPCYCVSIAFELDGTVLIGVVYDPTRDEAFYALKGGGAFLNGEPIHVSEQDNLEDALLVTGFPYDIALHPEIHLGMFSDLIVKARGLRRDGSAAIDLCYIACGRFDAYWELGLSPWDVAAGNLIVSEAGGKISDFFGREHNLLYRDIVATNGKMHPAIMQACAKYHEALLSSPYYVKAGERAEQ